MPRADRLNSQTNIFLLPYHSEPDQDIADARGRFEIVERAIIAGEFPYDNGDDPSFYVERHGGRLTWGVCRPNVRSQLKVGDIAVFFSFTTVEPDSRYVLYRLSAVATVEAKLDHRAPFSDPRLKGSEYINTLIRPEGFWWKYDETDRREQARHGDWFWRIADRQGNTQERFNELLFARVCKEGGFADAHVKSGVVRLAGNYILFSNEADKTLVAPVPPDVAVAEKGHIEQWNHQTLRRLTVGTAADHGKRDHLRTLGQGHIHPPIRFSMAADEARVWRSKLITALAKGAIPAAHRSPDIPPQTSTGTRKRAYRHGRCGC